MVALMPTANYGWTYPDSTGSSQIWGHFATLAAGIDTSLAAAATVAHKEIFCDKGGSGVNLVSNFFSEATCYTKSGLALTANRAYLVEFEACAISGASGTFPMSIIFRIKQAGTVVGTGFTLLPATAKTGRVLVRAVITTGASPGSPTWTVTAARDVGSTNLDVTDGSTEPFVFRVVDIGPSSIVT
jgi:hypothetical protein